MANPKKIDDNEILRLSLIGLEQQLANTNAAISGIRKRLGIRGPRLPVASTDGTQPAPRKRRMSAAARKRIGEATRRRWQAFRAAKAGTEKPAEKPKKRRMSATAKKRIADATRKRWAAYRKAKKAAA